MEIAVFQCNHDALERPCQLRTVARVGAYIFGRCSSNGRPMGDNRRSTEPVCHAVVLSNKVRAVTNFALGLSHAGSWHLVLLTQASASIKDVSSAAKQVANTFVVINLAVNQICSTCGL